MPGTSASPATLPPARRSGPWRRALWPALLYMGVCAAYIILSGWAAQQFATDMDQLRLIETVKGVLFVLSTGAVFLVTMARALARIDAQEDHLREHRLQLARAEGRATAGVLASSVAHDLGNLLTIAGFEAGRLGAAAQNDRLREAADRLRRTIAEMVKLTRGMGSIGRASTGRGDALVDVAEVVGAAVELARVHKAVRSCSLTLHADGAGRVRGQGALLTNAILNLIINAAEAVLGTGRTEGRIDVRVRRTQGTDGLPDPTGGVVVEVHDDGPGIPEEQHPRLFEAFATTKQAGSGLGLVSVKACAEQFGGSVTVARSDPLGGTCFRMVLPPAGNVRPAARPGSGSDASPPGAGSGASPTAAGTCATPPPGPLTPPDTDPPTLPDRPEPDPRG